MENVYRFISDLGNYLNLIRRTGNAEIEMQKEPTTMTLMKDNYDKLVSECVKMYKHINKTFDEEIIELSHSLIIEINKRDREGQIALKNQLVDLINPYLRWLDKMNNEGGFSLYSVHELRYVELEETEDGGKTEVDKFYTLTLHGFAQNLIENIKRIQILIDDKFKFLNSNSDLDNSKGDECIAKKHLECLSGYWKGNKIMKDEEYKRLIDYAKHTIEHNKIPKQIKPIPKGFCRLSKGFYQQTIYSLWKELNLANKSVNQSTWRDFTTAVFKDQYQNSSNDTLAAKFAEYKGNYPQDKGLITY